MTRTFFLFLTLAFTCSAQSRNVIVLPAGSSIDPNNRAATILDIETWKPLGAPAVGIEAYNAFTLPDGTKTYVVAKSATNTVTILGPLNRGGQVLKSLDIGTGLTDAALTPDGSRLLIASLNYSALTIVDTVTDTIVARVPLASPANSVVASIDSTRAYSFSPSSPLITAIDLERNQPAGTLKVSGELSPANSLSIAPNGLLYVAAGGFILEIEPRTLRILTGNRQARGAVGAASFSPDGQYIFYTSPYNPTARRAEILMATLFGDSMNGIYAAPGAAIDRLRVVSPSTAIGYSPVDRTFYQMDWSYLGGISPIASLSSLGNAPVSALGGTHETPRNRYLFVSSGNTVYRVTTGSNVISASYTLNHPAGRPIAPPMASTAPLADLKTFGRDLSIQPGQATTPLVFRALDGEGHPIAGATVQFDSANLGTLTNQFATTNSDGYAETVAVAPNSPIKFNVTANIGTSAEFLRYYSITAGSPPVVNPPQPGGNNGPGKIAIFSGNGQLVYSSNAAPRNMVVQVMDPAGKGMAGIPVTWTVLNGGGSLATIQTLTDVQGLSSNRYTGPYLAGFQSNFSQTAVQASIADGPPVRFTMVTLPQGSPSTPLFENGPIPGLVRLSPAGLSLSVEAGSLVRGAVRYKLTSQWGLSPNQGIPGISIEAANVSSFPPQTVSCAGNPVTDSEGIVDCDLQVGSRTGTITTRIFIGGRPADDLSLTTIAGPAKYLRVVEGDKQWGIPGEALPLRLAARVEDGSVNAISNIPVTWTVASGNATLSEISSTSDSAGVVSARVRLGAVPGDVRVRVSLSSGESAEFVLAKVTTLVRVSGDRQIANPSTPFARPLVLVLREVDGGYPRDIPVTFTATGNLTFSASTVKSDFYGRVQVDVTAGTTAGMHIVTATAGSASTTFTLSVRATDSPISSVINGASFITGLSPCAVARLNGTGFATGVTTTLLGQASDGSLATSLEGISVTINDLPAPLYSVSRRGNVDSLSFQVPCEVSPGRATLRLKFGYTSLYQPVAIQPVSPGLFETVDGEGRVIAVALRSDGSYVSSTNPAAPGEDIRVFATGLGQTTPAISTNVPGSGLQKVNTSVIVGLNDEGISARVDDTVYLQSSVGVYVVTFRMPDKPASGPGRMLIAAQSGDGSLVYSQTSSLDIR